MRKIVSLMALVVSFVVVTSAFAERTVDLPAWRYLYNSASNYHMTSYYITNRSNKEITATFDLRDSQGNPVTKAIASVGGVQKVPFGLEVTIPAYGQGHVPLYGFGGAGSLRGAGSFSWKYSDDPEDHFGDPIAITVLSQYVSGGEITNDSVQVFVKGQTWF